MHQSIMRRYCLFVLLFLVANNIAAQQIDDFINMLGEKKPTVVKYLKGLGYKIVHKQKTECSILKMEFMGEITILNFCENNKKALTHISMITKGVNKYQSSLLAMMDNEDFTLSKRPVAKYTASVFMNALEQEVVLVNLFDSDLHSISVSSFSDFDTFKENIELGFGYNEEKDPGYQFLKLVTTKNSAGSTIEEVIKKHVIVPTDPTMSPLAYLIENNEGENVEKMKTILDAQFLNDEQFISGVKNSLLYIGVLANELLSGGEYPEPNSMETVALYRLYENGYYGSLLMLNHIVSSIQPELSK